jgi:hypothetical protein
MQLLDALWYEEGSEEGLWAILSVVLVTCPKVGTRDKVKRLPSKAWAFGSLVVEAFL